MSRYRRILSGFLMITLGGCGAVGAVDEAATPLDAFTLSAIDGADVAGSDLHIVVEMTEAAGALATDRILIKPNAIQAQYLPAGRWTDPAPVLMQTLLVTSLQNSGGFLRVGRNGAGLLPDYTVLSDLQDFQAEAAPDGSLTWIVRVRFSLSIVRESDRRIISTHQFEATAAAETDDTAALVNAFHTAVSEILDDGVGWVLDETR
jgi:cholesterol transport system auxiliary component